MLVLGLLGRLALVLTMPATIIGVTPKEKLTHAATLKLSDSSEEELTTRPKDRRPSKVLFTRCLLVSCYKNKKHSS